MVDGSEGEWHGRRRRTFIEQTVGNARHCLHHGGIVVGVLAHLVQSVEDAQRREHAEDLRTISWLFADRIIEEIELQELSEPFERGKLFHFSYLICAEHQSLNVS